MNEIIRKIGLPIFNIGDKVRIALSKSPYKRRSYNAEWHDGEEGTVVGIFLIRSNHQANDYKYTIEVGDAKIMLYASDLEKIEEETHHMYIYTSTSGSTYDKLRDALDATRYGLASQDLTKKVIFSDTRISPETINKAMLGKIKKVIFNNPATIVFWTDGTKTVVKCDEYDVYDKEKGLAMCIVKHSLGNTGNYYNIFKKWCGESKNTYPSFMSKVFCKFLTGDDEYHKLGFVKDGDLNGKDTK